VTLGFWVIKILTTTLGETGGDAVSMTTNLGYLVGSAIFLALLVGFIWWQIAARRFDPFLYWGTVIASTTAGDDDGGLRHPLDRHRLCRRIGAAAALVLASLFAWHRT